MHTVTTWHQIAPRGREGPLYEWTADYTIVIPLQGSSASFPSPVRDGHVVAVEQTLWDRVTGLEVGEYVAGR